MKGLDALDWWDVGIVLDALDDRARIYGERGEIGREDAAIDVARKLTTAYNEEADRLGRPRRPEPRFYSGVSL